MSHGLKERKKEKKKDTCYQLGDIKSVTIKVGGVHIFNITHWVEANLAWQTTHSRTKPVNSSSSGR